MRSYSTSARGNTAARWDLGAAARSRDCSGWIRGAARCYRFAGTNPIEGLTLLPAAARAGVAFRGSRFVRLCSPADAAEAAESPGAGGKRAATALSGRGDARGARRCCAPGKAPAPAPRQVGAPAVFPLRPPRFPGSPSRRRSRAGGAEGSPEPRDSQPGPAMLPGGTGEPVQAPANPCWLRCPARSSHGRTSDAGLRFGGARCAPGRASPSRDRAARSSRRRQPGDRRGGEPVAGTHHHEESARGIRASRRRTRGRQSRGAAPAVRGKAPHSARPGAKAIPGDASRRFGLSISLRGGVQTEK